MTAAPGGYLGPTSATTGVPHEPGDHGGDGRGHDHGDDSHAGDHDRAADHDHDHAGDRHDHAGGHDHTHHDHSHAGLRGFLTGLVRPHSHDAADSVDSALEASQEGMRALKLSLAGLTVTACIQLAILVLSGSVALLADTVHNFADALTAVPLALAFWLGRRPANRRYTYGYGRSEDLAGVFVVALVAASAVVTTWEAVSRLVHPATVTALPFVAVAGGVGVAGNEVVARYRIRVGRRIGSAALEADGYHARTDGLSSLGVVAGAVGVMLGWKTADPVFGLVITAVILLAVKDSARDIYRRLMDAVDPRLVAQVEAVLSTTPGVERVDSVRLRWIGHSLHAEAEVTSDARMSLRAAHDVAEDGRHRLLHQVRRLTSVTVHTSPCSHDGIDPHARTAHHASDGG